MPSSAASSSSSSSDEEPEQERVAREAREKAAQEAEAQAAAAAKREAAATWMADLLSEAGDESSTAHQWVYLGTASAVLPETSTQKIHPKF